MSRVHFTVRKHLPLPGRIAYDELVDWRGHAEWVPMTRVVIEAGDGAVGTTFVATTGLGPLFHGSRCADGTHPKPHPAMLLELMDEFGCTPERTLMIGDTSYDMLMAREAGATAIGVSWGYHPAAHLRDAGAAHLVDDYTQLRNLIEHLLQSRPRHLRIAGE